MNVWEVDVAISDLDIWIPIAAKALLSFHDESRGVFWRNEVSRASDNDSMHPTSTSRSAFALVEFCRWSFEEAKDIESVEKDDTTRESLSALANVVDLFLSKYEDDLQLVRRSKSNDLNMFTDAHLMQLIAACKGFKELSRRCRDQSVVEKAQAVACGTVMGENLAKLSEWLGGKVVSSDEIHDFVTLYTVRGFDAIADVSWIDDWTRKADFQRRVRDQVLAQLGLEAAGVHSKFDPNELTFSLSLLQRFPTTDTPHIAKRGITAVVAAQASDGSWPPARLVSYEGEGLLHVASWEVALALTDMTLRGLKSREVSQFEQALPALMRSFDLVRNEYVDWPERNGWANDHARRTGRVESWATAIVLVFLIHLRDALMEYRQCLVLSKYDVVYPSDLSEQVVWPDLEPLLKRAGGFKWETLDRVSDPTGSRKLVSALRETLLKPIEQSLERRPRQSSMILYGPPGTRKTSLVQALASTMSWPLVTIAPPQFLGNGGLEGFETAASELFADLLRLRRVVILFDECEDFFKARPKEQDRLESRTIGAFITAGMLPRLQRLRDQRWSIFVLATNSELDALDRAVMRMGRFDFAERLAHPVRLAQEEYIRDHSAKLDDRTLRQVVSALDAVEEYVIARRTPDTDQENWPSVSFQMLDLVAKGVKGGTLRSDSDSIANFLIELVDRKGPPSLSAAE